MNLNEKKKRTKFLAHKKRKKYYFQKKIKKIYDYKELNNEIFNKIKEIIKAQKNYIR